MTNNPIGIFDSGVGGLSVLAEVQALLPNEHFIYFGDNANIPYGEKTEKQLLIFSKNILDWYKTQDVKMVIMACNTSSAVTLPSLKDRYDFDILGLIEPISKHIANQNFSKIGMIATNATVKSNAYKNHITQYPNKEFHQIACPGLVELVENNKTQTTKAKELVKKYITPLLKNDVEKIILGCTHYPFLRETINEIIGEDILLNPAKYLAKEAFEKVIKTSSTTGKMEFYTSKAPDKFVISGQKFYPQLKSAKLLELNTIKMT